MLNNAHERERDYRRRESGRSRGTIEGFTCGATRARRNAEATREELKVRARSTAQNSACSDSVARDTSGWNGTRSVSTASADAHAHAPVGQNLLPRWEGAVAERGHAYAGEAKLLAVAVIASAGRQRQPSGGLLGWLRRVIRVAREVVTAFQSFSPAQPNAARHNTEQFSLGSVQHH
jgi:hypothetical protein